MKMMREKEIGSEFHYTPVSLLKEAHTSIIRLGDDSFTFSGRTAMETVLHNLPGVRKALLPSYCCDSMIVPFRKMGIAVNFYDVFWDGEFRIELDIHQDIDLLVWCNYFGFTQRMPALSQFIARGGIIIEDITHSYLSEKSYHTQSQYLVASVRKWLPLLCGGYCASRVGQLCCKPSVDVPAVFTDRKIRAMKQKTLFLENGDETQKERYLQDFSWCNTWVAEHYANTKIDGESLRYLEAVDTGYVRKRRRENAAVIYRYLDAQENVVPLFTESEMDCPLFVPIICKDYAQREMLRKKLIGQKVYCPAHWPRPNDDCKSNLYDLELSLICDQRYGAADMERMMNIVCE